MELFSGSKTEQGIVSASVNYFTGLLESGKWKFRLFIKPSITLGINRNSNDSLTIKDGFGLDGFNSSGLSGTRRLLLTLQTQSYAPWNVIGFRFGPYLIYSAGMLGDSIMVSQEQTLFSDRIWRFNEKRKPCIQYFPVVCCILSSYPRNWKWYFQNECIQNYRLWIQGFCNR